MHAHLDERARDPRHALGRERLDRELLEHRGKVAQQHVVAHIDLVQPAERLGHGVDGPALRGDLVAGHGELAVEERVALASAHKGLDERGHGGGLAAGRVAEELLPRLQHAVRGEEHQRVEPRAPHHHLERGRHLGDAEPRDPRLHDVAERAHLRVERAHLLAAPLLLQRAQLHQHHHRVARALAALVRPRAVRLPRPEHRLDRPHHRPQPLHPRQALGHREARERLVAARSRLVVVVVTVGELLVAVARPHALALPLNGVVVGETDDLGGEAGADGLGLARESGGAALGTPGFDGVGLAVHPELVAERLSAPGLLHLLLVEQVHLHLVRNVHALLLPVHHPLHVHHPEAPALPQHRRNRQPLPPHKRLQILSVLLLPLVAERQRVDPPPRLPDHVRRPLVEVVDVLRRDDAARLQLLQLL
mmetsp:Transcript_37581/g.88813  ORF Transcript_37581/g.88813 Transcript_37581/m.88813 type:complete len:421 (-) Transcript_37581:736-1998(-)